MQRDLVFQPIFEYMKLIFLILFIASTALGNGTVTKRTVLGSGQLPCRNLGSPEPESFFATILPPPPAAKSYSTDIHAKRLVALVGINAAHSNFQGLTDLAMEFALHTNFNSIYEGVVERANYYFNNTNYGPHSNFYSKGTIIRGDLVPEVVVGTHQSERFQESTAYWLETHAPLASVPRVFLASQVFPIVDRSYFEQATLVRYSKQGEVDQPILARKYHVFGGYCEACLKRTVTNLVSDAHAAGVGRPQVYLYLEHTYTVKATSDVTLDQYWETRPKRTWPGFKKMMMKSFGVKLGRRHRPYFLSHEGNHHHPITMIADSGVFDLVVVSSEPMFSPNSSVFSH